MVFVHCQDQEMRIVAYLYSDPVLEATPDPGIWGWEVDRVYQDLVIQPSTTQKGKNPAVSRLQWQQLLQDSQTEPVDYLLLLRLEDLGDSLTEIHDRLNQLESHHIPLLILDAPPDSTSGTAPKIALLQLLQHLQFSQRSRRIRQGHARNRVNALPPPGKAPYGYKRGKTSYVLDRATAPVVKDFFEQFLLFGSLRGAVRYLAKKYNKKIAVSTGQRWLTSPVYRGDLEYQNGDILPGTHAAILSREEAAQVDRLLRRNRRLPPRTASAPRSLAGLVQCRECQSPMTVTRVTSPHQTREYLYLRPTACPRNPHCRAIAYDQILQATIQRICQELPCAVADVPLPDMERVKQEIDGAIANKQAILAQLPELIESGILDQETATLRTYTVKTEIAQLQNRLAQLPPVNLKSIAQAVSIPQFWLDLSESERRFYFREFIRQITLNRQGQDWQLELVFIF
jgi:DNA invertase Pin-like site-specific DNA recombinase